jgi:hypothetical protein
MVEKLLNEDYENTFKPFEYDKFLDSPDIFSKLDTLAKVLAILYKEKHPTFIHKC